MILNTKDKTKMINKAIKTIIVLIFYLSYFSNTIYSQNPDNFSKSKQIGKVPDSLLQKTFEELETAFDDHLNDSLRSYLYAKRYLKKAKQEFDTTAIAKGIIVNFKENIEKS